MYLNTKSCITLLLFSHVFYVHMVCLIASLLTLGLAFTYTLTCMKSA